MASDFHYCFWVTWKSCKPFAYLLSQQNIFKAFSIVNIFIPLSLTHLTQTEKKLKKQHFIIKIN